LGRFHELVVGEAFEEGRRIEEEVVDPFGFTGPALPGRGGDGNMNLGKAFA
jgi:hypothetical protein